MYHFTYRWTKVDYVRGSVRGERLLLLEVPVHVVCLKVNPPLLLGYPLPAAESSGQICPSRTRSPCKTYVQSRRWGAIVR